MDGIIIINKEKNYTSRDVVNKASGILHTKKIGHTGTLDPLAEGVLVLAVNSATKVIELLSSDDKEYIATAKIGYTSDTLDITGNLIEDKTKKTIIKEDLLNILNSFKGSYNQQVPKYSAVKINGKRLYEYARNNIDIELPSRIVNIKDIELLEYKNDTFKFRVVVSKGTYIRSLIRDIGIKLNTNCIMSDLLRTRQGIFKIEDSVKIDDITEKNIISILDSLNNYKKIEVSDEDAFKIINGVKIKNIYNIDICVFVNKENKLLAIYKDDSLDNLKAFKVFN